MRIRDITGQVFGRLVAMHRSPPMDDFNIGRAVGLFAGAFIGICIAALLVVSKGEST